MSFHERSAARRAADVEKRQLQPAIRSDFYDLPADQRRAIRQAEAQGRMEAERLATITEQQRKQAAIDATPEHLRRPENVYHKMIALLEPSAYRPDVKRRIAQYEQRAAAREREIENEMADKLRQFTIENNPETAPAREHWQKASAGAEPGEEQDWARLRGLIEGGAAATYWQEVKPVLDARLQRLQEQIAEHAGRQAPLAEEAEALTTALADVSALQITETDPNNEQVTE